MRYLDILAEAKSQIVNWGGNSGVVYRNPMRTELMALISRFKLMRGLTDGRDIYVWDAHKLVHMQVIDAMKEANPDFACDIYSFDKMFFIGRLNDVDTEGREWMFNKTREIMRDLFVFSDTFKLLETIPTFNRIIPKISYKDA